ncbi:MAG: hypothetical protein ACRCV9_18590 [Burkholderiaceae bacterium]
MTAPSSQRRAALHLLLRIAAAGAACVVLSAHSPYGQWDAFRKARLIVFANAQDARSQTLAKAVAARIDAAEPASKATWARAPNAFEQLKLLDSHQADVILLTPAQAADAKAGQGAYAKLGAQPIKVLAVLEDYLLVSLDEYPQAHAWRIAKALKITKDGSALPQGLEHHEGVLSYLAGKEMPALAEHKH